MFSWLIVATWAVLGHLICSATGGNKHSSNNEIPTAKAPRGRREELGHWLDKGEGWTFWRDHKHKGSVLWVRDAEYLPETRHVRIHQPGNTSSVKQRTCPAFDPKKIEANDPVGSRRIGALHNKYDEVLKTLMTCEVAPFKETHKCVRRNSMDLFVWQPDLAFYTHGSGSLLNWLHDFISPLLHAVQLAESFNSSERGLVVLHHSFNHRPRQTHHTSLGGGRRDVLRAAFGAGVWTLDTVDPVLNTQGEGHQNLDSCVRVRKLVVGAGQNLGAQGLRYRRGTVAMLRAAGYLAAGVTEPKPLADQRGHASVLHVLAPHQHRHLHDHHHSMHRNMHHSRHRNIGGDGTLSRDLKGHHRHRESNDVGEAIMQGQIVFQNRKLLQEIPNAQNTSEPHVDPRGPDPHHGSAFMIKRFAELEQSFATRHLKWNTCCHVRQNHHHRDRHHVSAIPLFPHWNSTEEKDAGDRISSSRALSEAIQKLAGHGPEPTAVAVVGTNSPSLAVCLWGAEGIVTIDFSPEGPHDKSVTWRLCGWATNGSYVKVSVPRYVSHHRNMRDHFTSPTRSSIVSERTSSCTVALLAATRFRDTTALSHRYNWHLLRASELCRPRDTSLDPASLCGPGLTYEKHRLDVTNRGDVCRGGQGSRDDCGDGDGPCVCPRACRSSSGQPPFCVNAGFDNSSSESSEIVKPCRAMQVIADEAKLAEDGHIIVAGHWNPRSIGMASSGVFGNSSHEKLDRFEPAWYSVSGSKDAAAAREMLTPSLPADPGRRGAYKKIDREKARKQGCYQSLAKSREKNAMWCPKGAGASTAG